VALICRTDDEAREINATRHVARAPSFELPDAVRATARAPAALAAAAALVLAVPSRSVRENARALRDALPSGVTLVHAVKGLEHGSAKRVSEMLREELTARSAGDLCVLSGPNLAPEIQQGLPAATVIAGAGAATVSRAQALFHQPAFRVYASGDLPGVELAGSLKNVVAIAAGIADGLGFGDNAKAGIITRGLAEITRLGIAAGAAAPTFSGLAGTGDVIATCYSAHSRNRRTGEAIARGAGVAEAVASAGGEVEGIEATAGACTLAGRHGVDMPIAHALRDVLFAGAHPLDAIRGLLEREPTREAR